MAQDLAALGAPKELVELHEQSESFEIYEENIESVEIFLRLSTQWNSSEGYFKGLNYQSINTIFEILETKNRKLVFDNIQIMELAAIAVLNKSEE